MNRKDLYQSMNQIDDDILERSEADAKNTNKTVWFKLGTMVAGFAVVMIAAISMLQGNGTEQISVGGVVREYKKVSVGSEEEAIVWPWEYKTVYEKYPMIIYEGREYTTKTFGLAADENLIGDKIGACEAVGYDVYSEKEYRQNMDVWKINGISADLMIAVEMEGQFYTFKYNGYVPPVTFGEVLDNYSLSQTLTLNKFGVYEEGKEAGYYSLDDDDYIWQILNKCRDAKFVEDEVGSRISRDRITFTASSEILGVYKRVFYVTPDGYISTNIFDWAYTFCIGEDAATDIISYANKHAVKAEREPYTYSLVGTITEIGDGYILVDDSVLCVDESDGMVFKVLTSDLRIRRHIDYQKISTGSIVVIWFTELVNVEAGNIVSGAISMAKGTVYEDEVIVTE